MRWGQKINQSLRPSRFLVKGYLPGLIVIALVASGLLAGFFCGAIASDHGPYGPYFAPDHGFRRPANESPLEVKGFLFDESSKVSGSGEVSIKGSFQDNAVDSSGWMKGSGSINLESLRNLNKIRQEVDFTQRSDLVFEGGQLKNKKSLRLPLFENGVGATVRERFNLSHVDQSETNIIRSRNGFNNTMLYDTALAYEGLWNIQNLQGWSMVLNGSDETYTGSFQTQKRIEYNDSARA